MNLSSKTTSNKEIIAHHQYGLLSMIALIVGSVIGSGVYIVNDKLYINSGHSTGLSMMAWIIISLIVLFMLISFIEISSITAKSGEPGTVNNWTRHLWGPKYSKYIGVFFPLIYFPILLSSLTIIMSNELLSNFSRFEQFNDPNLITDSTVWAAYGYDILIGFVFINLIYGMNALTMRPGKAFQEIGTVIKLIPLFSIIFIGILAFAGLAAQGAETNDVFDFSHDSQGNVFLIVLLLTPTVMFSYDGFLFAASLQNEAKKPSTYKTAAITGIIFIILTYLLVAIFSYQYGDPVNGFSVTASITNIFPEASSWIVPIFSVMIMVSILNTLSGNSISQNRMIADLSATNEIRDSNGTLIARNRALVPQGAAMMAWIITLIGFFAFRFLDGIALLTYNLDPIRAEYNYFPIQGWSLDLLTLISYCFYVFIIFGAIINRKTKKADVEKNKAFLPCAITSCLVIGAILVVFAYGTFAPGSFLIEGTNQISKYSLTTYILEIFVTLAVVFLIFFLPFYLERNVRKAGKAEKKKKARLVKAYREKIVAEKYFNQVNKK